MKLLSLFYLCVCVAGGGGGGVLFLNLKGSCVTKCIKIQTVKSATTLSETKN